MPYILWEKYVIEHTVWAVQMLQNIWYKETYKIEKERISTQRHRNISLLKRVLVNFSLVICMNYYYR
jgi:hypothetical protein